MVFQDWTILLLAIAYVAALFGVATWGDSVRARRGGLRRPKPFVYALSLGIYCTSWTYFGSVGIAARTGYDFIPVYLGPILMFALGAPLISRIVHIAKRQNIASMADFIAARYGKSEGLGALVAIIATVGIVPYISIQLKALAFSLEAVMRASGGTPQALVMGGDLALFVTLTLAVFAILFGTRHVDATEHQDGMMLAIAVESVVKLVAFLTVGLFVTFALAGGPLALANMVRQSPQLSEVFSFAPSGGRWLTVTALSAFAILLLPRQFHVAVVENAHRSDVRRAAWMFPLYLIVINIFVAPIAIVGLATLPGVDADTYVLALPVTAGAGWISIIAFIGGVSAATAMVVVEAIALAVMISNNVIVPLVLLRQGEHNMFQHAAGGERSPALITIRRITICAILALAYVYYLSAGNSVALAQTGLISFAAVAQFAPAFFGGLVWRGGTARGAAWGIMLGFAVWAYTLLLPSFVDSGWLSDTVLREGPFGISALRPRELLGLEFDPLTHGVVWSLLLNTALYLLVSLARAPSRIEQLQAGIFVQQDEGSSNPGFRLWRSSVTVGQLESTVARYLGQERARSAFAEFASQRNLDDDPSMEADIGALNHGERLIASAVGPASSRLVMALLLERHAKGSRRAIQMLDDASSAIQHSRDLLQSAIDNVPQGIAVFGRERELVCWNPVFRELLEVPQEVARVGTPLREIARLVQRQATGSDFANEALEQRLWHMSQSHEKFRERFAGQGRVVDIHSRALPDGGIVVTFEDVTDNVTTADALQKANETLEQRVRERTAQLTKLNAELARAKASADTANQGKTRFIAAASHDILQPLNAARLFTSTLMESGGSSGQRDLIRSVDSSLEAVEDILSTVLDISRFDAGAVKPEITHFRVSDLLEQLRTEFAPLAARKKLQLTIVPSRSVVKSDRRLLRRILQNLLSNAIKYTPQGRVLVGCKHTGSSIKFRVCDTGSGIPAAQQKIIFREFERLGRDKGAEPGLGLGLSIVERMCRVLRHPLTMQSEEGRGTAFSVEVPLGREVPVDTASADHMPDVAPTALSGLRVLTVDNEQAIVDGLAALLQRWGVQVVQATSAAEAIAVTEQAATPWDVIVADYHIHREDGIALVQSLRHRLKLQVPALLITADRSLRVRELAAQADIVYLRKPVKPAALRAALAQCAARRVVTEEKV